MLDGVELGIASSGNPLNRRGLLPGKYKLRIEAPGYLPREQTIQIMRNAWEQVVVQLQAEPKQQPFEPVMVEIPGGSFLMGDLSGDGDEKPVHKVQVKSFLLAETETTFAQWDACVDAGDCSNKPGDKDQGHGDTPVTNVSWEDIQEYIAWLNISTGKSYRLPSESEWEYAARAGSATKYSWGDGIDCTKARYGFSYNQCGKQQSPDLVKSYQANAYGLFDMHGNVWEWVGDCWNRSYHGAPSDGSVWNSDHCESRVLRGGSWFNKPSGLRSAIRGGYDASIRGSRSGFRLARDP